MEFSVVVENHRSKIRDRRVEEEREKILRESPDREQQKKYRKEEDFDEPIWNFHFPQISVKKKLRRSFEKPSLEMQLEYLQGKRWNRFREYGNQDMNNLHDLKKINVFSEIFSPSIYLPITSKEVRYIFTYLDRAPFGRQVKGLTTMKELCEKTMKDMIENKKNALDRLEKSINDQIHRFETDILGYIKKHLDLAKSFEESEESRLERSQKEVTYTNRTPFSNLIEFCQDVFMVIFSYLETVDLLVNVSPSFLFFHHYVKKKVALTFHVNPRYLTRVQFHKFYGEYKLQKLVFGKKFAEYYGRTGHIRRTELPTLFKDHPELKDVELYNLESCRILLSAAEWKRLRGKFPERNFGKGDHEKLSADRIRKTFDSLSMITSLERLRTCSLPRDMTGLVNLRVLIYPINFEFYEKESVVTEGFNFQSSSSSSFDVLRVTNDLKELTMYFMSCPRPKMKELVLCNNDNRQLEPRKIEKFMYDSEFLPLFVTLHDSIAMSCPNLEKMCVRMFTGFTTFSDDFLRYLSKISTVTLYLLDEYNAGRNDQDFNFDFDFTIADDGVGGMLDGVEDDTMYSYHGTESAERWRARDWEVWDEEKEREDEMRKELERSDEGLDWYPTVQGNLQVGGQQQQQPASSASSRQEISFEVNDPGIQQGSGFVGQSSSLSFDSASEKSKDGSSGRNDQVFRNTSTGISWNFGGDGQGDGQEGEALRERGEMGGTGTSTQQLQWEEEEEEEENKAEQVSVEETKKKKIEVYEALVVSSMDSKVSVFANAMLERSELMKKNNGHEFRIEHFQDSKAAQMKMKEALKKKVKEDGRDEKEKYAVKSVGDRFLELITERVPGLTYDLKIEEDYIIANVGRNEVIVEDGNGFDFGDEYNEESCDPRTLMMKILEDLRLNRPYKLSIDLFDANDAKSSSDKYDSEVIQKECFGVLEKLLVVNNPSLEVLEFSIQYKSRIAPQIGDDGGKEEVGKSKEEESIGDFSFGDSVEGQNDFGAVEIQNEQAHGFSSILLQQQRQQQQQSGDFSLSFASSNQHQQQSFSFGESDQRQQQQQQQQQESDFSFGENSQLQGQQQGEGGDDEAWDSFNREESSSGFDFDWGEEKKNKNIPEEEEEEKQSTRICYFPETLLKVIQNLNLGGGGGGGRKSSRELSSSLHTLKMNLFFGPRCFVMLEDLSMLLDSVFEFLIGKPTLINQLEVNIFVNEVMFLKKNEGEGRKSNFFLPMGWSGSRKYRMKKLEMVVDDDDEELTRRLDVFENQVREKFGSFQNEAEKKLSWENVRIGLEMKYAYLSKRRNIFLKYRKRI